MLLNCGVGEDSWESLGLQGDPPSPSWRRSVLSVHWRDWCWSWNSNTLATWCEGLTHLKRPWCWERLRAREGDDRGWDGWMASLTQWTWVWVESKSCWWTGSRTSCCGSSTTTTTKSLQSVQLCATPETAAHQAPPFLGFSRQEHWSGLPFMGSLRVGHDWADWTKLKEPLISYYNE